MMSKEQMLQVLGAMDEDALTRALGAAGIDAGGQGQGGAGGDGGEGEDGLTSWNATSVQLPSSNRPPLYDRNAHVAAQQGQAMQQMGAQAPVPPEQTGVEDFSPGAGLATGAMR